MPGWPAMFVHTVGPFRQGQVISVMKIINPTLTHSYRTTVNLNGRQPRFISPVQRETTTSAGQNGFNLQEKTPL